MVEYCPLLDYLGVNNILYLVRSQELTDPRSSSGTSVSLCESSICSAQRFAEEWVIEPNNNKIPWLYGDCNQTLKRDWIMVKQGIFSFNKTLAESSKLAFRILNIKHMLVTVWEVFIQENWWNSLTPKCI